MDTIDLALILKQYGLMGFILVFCFLVIRQVLLHFMKKDDRKDEQILSMGREFTTALNSNTEATQDLKVAMCGFSHSLDTLSSIADKSDNEHREILTFVRDRRVAAR